MLLKLKYFLGIFWYLNILFNIFTSLFFKCSYVVQIMSIQTGSSETWRMQLTEGTACYLSLTRPSILPQIEWRIYSHRLEKKWFYVHVCPNKIALYFFSFLFFSFWERERERERSCIRDRQREEEDKVKKEVWKEAERIKHVRNQSSWIKR